MTQPATLQHCIARFRMIDSPAKLLKTALAAAATGAVICGLGAVAGWCPSSAIWPVATVCGVLAAVIRGVGMSLASMVDNRSHTLRDRVEGLRRDIGDIHGLVRLQPYTAELPLPMGGGWALTGDAAALLVREVLLQRPRAVLELGSGVSTLLIGQALQRQGGEGRLLSIDHDPVWAERTRRQVALLGLERQVTVVCAPLAPIDLQGTRRLWYDIPASALDTLGAIDLLLVDGPPQPPEDREPARWPAVPALESRLSASAVVVVDDARRPEEREMVRRWRSAAPDWQVEDMQTVDGLCILRRRPSGEAAAT